MQSKFEINSLRKKRLIEMLNTLFPEYSLIRIKRNGFILFGTRIIGIPIIKYKVHISELCIDELPKRLGKYRRGNIPGYLQVIDQYLEHILSNNVCNPIDFLYQEYSNIKSSSKIDILLEDSQKSLPESNPDSITIGTIIKEAFYNSDISSIIKALNNLTSKESTKDQYRRLLFLSRF